MRIENLGFHYGDLCVFDALSLEVETGRVTAILGPSGCGKTTLLKILAGLLEPVGSDPHGDLPVLRALRSSFLFQEPRLIPWLTALENLVFPLPDPRPAPGPEPRPATNAASVHSTAAAGRRELARHYLNLVGLLDFHGYRPHQLSGGMKQRVAMARAFAYPSEVLYMDEPMQGIDIGLKRALVGAFVQLWRSDPRTTVLVTHDIAEALLLGDRIFVLSSKPAEVRLDVRNTGELGERSMADRALLDVERRIYSALLG